MVLDSMSRLPMQLKGPGPQSTVQDRFGAQSFGFRVHEVQFFGYLLKYLDTPT